MTQGCPTGGLIQPFVIQALISYSRKVIEDGPEAYDSGLLHGASWHRTAEWLMEELDESYAHKE